MASHLHKAFRLLSKILIVMVNVQSKINRQRRKVSKKPPRMSGLQRRRQLIDAAKLLFSQKGFSATTTKEIAAHAKVNEAMIFRHFSGKEALYEAVVSDEINENCITEYCAEMCKAAENNNDEVVFDFAGRIIMHRYQSKRDILRILIFGILENRPHIAERFEVQILPLRKFLADYIIKRQAQGVLQTENADVAVFGFLGMITHHTMVGELVCEEKKVVNDEEAIRLFTKTILDGLRKKNKSGN